MTLRVHPFPYRTRKLSPVVPKIVVWRRAVKIGKCQHQIVSIFLYSKLLPIAPPGTVGYFIYKNLLMRFFENEVGDDEKRMIILKLFERITVSRGTEEYAINFMMRSDYADFV